MSKKWNNLVLVFVILALIHLVLETTPFIFEKYQKQLIILDGLITSIFLIDFYLKIKKIREEKTPFKSRFFELIIDLFSILPFFISLFFTGLKIMSALRLFRMLRILKLMNLVKSHSLIINAMKNKKHELNISMQVVLLITIILSAILYFVENPTQPENFSSITDAFLWSLSKFIGEIGGYGDFAPVTISGKILATFVGILGIAIFAVPAGIIASGFVEEIEQIKKAEENENFYNKILSGFSTEHLVAYIRAKKQINLDHIRRKFFTLNDVKFKMNIPESSIMSIAEMEKGIRIRNFMKEGEEYTVVEFFEDSAPYGTFTNRESNITVISTHSKDQPFLGHFSYALSEYLQANYISIEKYSVTDFDPEKNVDFAINNSFLDEFGCEAIELFKLDLARLAPKNKLTILVRAAGAKFDKFELLNGKAAGEEFCSPGGTFDNINKLQKFKDEFQKIVEDNNKTVGFHSRLGNNEKNNLAIYLKNKLNMDNLQIHVGADLLKEDADDYYKTIEIVGEGFKSLISK
jgi:voltage-gated potassium channel